MTAIAVRTEPTVMTESVSRNLLHIHADSLTNILQAADSPPPREHDDLDAAE